MDQQRPPPRGNWPTLAAVAERDWQTVIKFLLIVLAIKIPASAAVVVLWLLLHR